MDRPQLPLNALRVFEAAARHLSFTQAALELCVTQTAVSHQIKNLESRLGVTLFRRVPRGLVLTDEGRALVPVLSTAFDQVGDVLDRFLDGRYRETLHVGVVSTFATGWLLPRMPDFTAQHPGIDLRVSTNNNRVDIAREGLDMAIRFGDGTWPGIEAVPLIETPLSPLCAPDCPLTTPADLAGHMLLRSYRSGEWESWFADQGLTCPDLRGPIFDNSLAMADMAARGFGIALLPVAMFAHEIATGRVVRPFAHTITIGRYWLTRLKSRPVSPAMKLFESWLVGGLTQSGVFADQSERGRPGVLSDP
ncbi:LysR family transcriptional regulator [Thalassococcus sp. S3]|uniref:LysR family transcriptional regulator n=1 Tax=Thalassococcus sp. S3 TaxID=2017482 RepID=UPI001024493B|nr:LysR family transcriptional regulator [Thalassococcus sp. S3]QBF32709.1 LysR family transcriptional regulator [Thalassococcus sp. S3]